MPTLRRRWLVLGSLGAVAALVAGGLWFGITYRPPFYRDLTSPAADTDRRQHQAAQFVRDATGLRNAIANDPRWEAIFTDDEVNAWLAEDLVAHFADLMPEGVTDPRLKFEADRVVLAFKLKNGPVTSVVWAVVRVGVPVENHVALTIEKIRAGALPVPSESLLDRLTEHARRRGVAVSWDKTGPHPVATIGYAVDTSRADIILEALDVSEGRIRLSGRSKVDDRGKTASPSLPSRRVLQMTFPRRRSHAVPGRVSALLPTIGLESVSKSRPDAPSPTSTAPMRSSSQDAGS